MENLSGMNPVFSDRKEEHHFFHPEGGGNQFTPVSQFVVDHPPPNKMLTFSPCLYAHLKKSPPAASSSHSRAELNVSDPSIIKRDIRTLLEWSYNCCFHVVAAA